MLGSFEVLLTDISRSFFDFDRDYIVVGVVAPELPSILAEPEHEPVLGQVMRFERVRGKNKSRSDNVLVYVDGKCIGQAGLEILHHLYFVDPWSHKSRSYRTYRIALPEDADAILAGVPLEDIYV